MVIFVECDPPTATAQEKGLGIRWAKGRPFIYHYKKAKVAAVHKLITRLFKPHAPPEPIAGPCLVQWTFLYKFRKNELKRVIKTGFRWKTTKPDAGNTSKEPTDALTKLGFFTDDAVICVDIARKAWCSVPGIMLEITMLDDADVPADILDVINKRR